MIPLAETADAFTAEDLALAESAVGALLQELEAYPKPGLVSRVDAGAHSDMDHDVMTRSAKALLQPFARIAAAGREASPFDGTLIACGLAAESEMLRATGGINTHRGAIFSLGMILASLALAKTSAGPVTLSTVREVLLETWGEALQSHAFPAARGPSHGAMARQATGAGGARVEAARGFPGVFEIGVPAYREALASGLDSNACRIQTLFVLMEAVEDTNVIYRGGAGAADFVRQSAEQFLAEGGCHSDGWFARAEGLHHEFTQRKLSPGGCADLLSGTLLLAAIL
ncbi:triphosphoribosyl-dephospho-CoA synthase MdcB [soil metagenome]